RLLVEAPEDETCEGRDTRNGHESEVLLHEVIAVPILERDSHQVTGVRVGPAVVCAAEEVGVPLLAQAHLRAAVAAPVEEGTNGAVVPSPGDEDRLPADPGLLEVARLGQLALMGEIDPRPVEDVLDLLAEDLGVPIDRAMNSPLVRNEILDVHRCDPA